MRNADPAVINRIGRDMRAPEIADVSETPAVCCLHLPKGEWRIRWYDPRSGEWQENPDRPQITGGYTREFSSPFTGAAASSIF